MGENRPSAIAIGCSIKFLTDCTDISYSIAIPDEFSCRSADLDAHVRRVMGLARLHIDGHLEEWDLTTLDGVIVTERHEEEFSWTKYTARTVCIVGG